MEMKVSDVLDRWTIVRMKARFDKDAKKELESYDAEVQALIKKDNANAAPGFATKMSSHTFLGYMMELMEANAKIWENEAAIRNEYKDDPANHIVRAGSPPDGKVFDYEKIGQRALIIRDLNRQRVAAKSKIDKLFGQISDNKVDHASA